MAMRSPFMQFALAVTMSACCAVALAQTQSVHFVEPADGATVTSPFKVRFAVDGMEVRPAGDMASNTGHHHLLINDSWIKVGQPIPADATHIHYGKGQTETEVTLPPGNYTLTMQFANGSHQSYGEPMAKTIKVTVR
jgi:hypothetical protein